MRQIQDRNIGAIRKRWINIIIDTLKRHRKYLIILTLTWGVFFTILWLNMLAVDDQGIIVRHEYVWSDWALHIGLGSIFQLRAPANWFISHPIYAGSSLSYPFFTNFISGILMRIGFSMQFAYIAPSLVFSLLLVYGIYFLTYQLTKSQKGGVLAVFIFFLGSGLGFEKAITALQHGNSLTNVLFPVEYYSRVETYQWYSGNGLVGMLIPQRAFLLGMTGVVWISNFLVKFLTVPRKAITKFSQLTKKRCLGLVLLGLVSGLMVITHVHSFIALVFIAAGLALISLKWWREWLVYAAAAGVVSLILYKTFIAGSIETSSFMQLQPWWTYGNPILWLEQWWRNWGWLWPLAIMGVVVSYRVKNRRLLGIAGGLFSLFILSNLILFQPVAWDNSKLFLWAYLGLTILAVVALLQLWRGKLKIMVVILVLLLTATGFLDLAKVMHTEATQNFYLEQTTGIELANFVAKNTPETAVILTAPTHNHPVTVLGARTIFMGYPGWLFNYGFNYDSRAKEVTQMYEQPQNSQNIFIKHQLHYVVIGPDERSAYQINHQYFAEHWQLVFSNQDYQLFYQ